MIREKHENYLLSALYLLFFILSLFMFNGSCLATDDCIYGVKENNYVPFFYSYYGSWLYVLFNRVMYVIPEKLGINITDWSCYFGPLLKSLLYTSTVFYMTKIVSLYKNVNKIAVSVFLFSAAFLFYGFYGTTTVMPYFIYEALFRFGIPSLFLLIFMYEFYKYYVLNEKNYTVLIIYSLLCTTSSEVSAVTVVLILFFGVLSSIVEKHKIKTSVLIFLISFFGFLIFILSKGCILHFLHLSDGADFAPAAIIANITEFSVLYYKFVILQYLPFWLIILVGTVFCTVVKDSEHSIKSALFNIYFVSGIFIFQVGLIVMGKTHYSGNFWLVHPDTYSVWIPSILSVTLLNFFYLSHNKKINNILFLIFMIFLLYEDILYTDYYTNLINVLKKQTYLRDKIQLFYIYKNEKAILPESVFYYNIYDVLSSKSGEMTFDNFIVESEIDRSRFTVLPESLVDIPADNYYKVVYGVNYTDENLKIEFTDNTTALKIFEEKGGTFDEVYTGKFKFSDLQNKDFVLNKVNTKPKSH